MPQFKFQIISRIDIERSQGGMVMLNAIDYDGPGNMIVTGCPGSGKTTVTLMRAEQLINAGKKVLVLTFQKLLKASLRNSSSLALKEHIDNLHGWYSDNFDKKWVSREDEAAMIGTLAEWAGVDELLIDEGQDFEEKIYKAFLPYCKRMSVGADNAQRLHRSGLVSEKIRAILEMHGTLYPVELHYNYRNSYEIYNFARYFLPANERVNNEAPLRRMKKGVSEKPVVYHVSSDEQKFEQMRTLLRDAGDKNVAILLFKIEDVRPYATKLESMGFACSWHTSEHTLTDDIENILVTTYISAKGLEFQVVIMPDLELAAAQYHANGEHFYVGATRARENLFLLYSGAPLPPILQKFDKDAYLHQEGIAAKKMAAADDDDLPF